ncbi:MAG: mercuric transporter MerT family protein [Planctomycetota bacterium]|nr:mercuric transporter MerT family protein [Planctomycetota bacterium]
MPDCPTCRKPGRTVGRVTLESLLRPNCRPSINDGPFSVCTARDCETVYFGSDGGPTFGKPDLLVPFGLKEHASPRPVCYCFDQTVENIDDEIRRTGQSTVLERIKEEMKGPGCRCEFTNPLGACCLATVQHFVREASERYGCNNPSGPSAKTVDAQAPAGCCGPGRVDSALTAAGSASNRSGVLAAGGSLVAAVLSSACCWLPLLLIAFGVSAAGVAGFFEACRPYLIVGAVVLLGIGFYRMYFRKERCEPGSACATSKTKMRITRQAILWAATVLVGASVFFPSYIGLVFGSSAPALPSAADARLVVAEFRIEGMTCEGCASILRGVLVKVPNAASVDVSYETKTAAVRHERDKPVSPDRVIEAIKAAGYEAVLIEEAP